MAEPSLNLGNGNWAGKSDNLLAYHKANNNFYADELTFARASTGTIVNADGLIEQVPYNRIEQSNTFDNTWSVGNSTITEGQADKDGGTSAWVIASTTIGSETRIRQSQTFTVGEVIALSCYMKAGTVNFGIVRTYSIAGGGRVWFNLLNGTVGTENSGLTGSIESVGGGWYRCSITGVVTTSGAIDIAPAPADNDYLANAVGESIYIQDAQLDSGSTAKTYYPTTTRLNVPRVTYKDNANGSLLLEPQRTNSLSYSEDFSNAAWVKLGQGVGSTPIVTPNYAISPDGTLNASRLQCDLNGGNTTSDRSWIYQSISTITGDNTFSLYVKNNSNEDITFSLTNGSSETVVILSDDKWHRLSTVRSGGGQPRIGLIGGVGASDNADLLIYGAQLEAGSYATSYIPTSGTTVTRNQDASSTTGLSDVIGQTEGTLFVEINKDFAEVSERYLAIGDGTTSNRIMIIGGTGGSIRGFISNGGAIQFDNSTGSAVGNHKIALAYAANDIAFYVDGVQIALDTSATIPAVGNFYLGTHEAGFTERLNGSANQAQLYKTRLTNTELATLTTI